MLLLYELAIFLLVMGIAFILVHAFSARADYKSSYNSEIKTKGELVGMSCATFHGPIDKEDKEGVISGFPIVKFTDGKDEITQWTNSWNSQFTICTAR